MLAQKKDRMLELLWFVGYCGEIPTQLANRLGVSREWGRHVMYRAIRDGYLTVWRGKHQQRVIRSLRLTESGLDYVGERAPEALGHILAKSHGGIITRNNLTRTLRRHSIATGLLMAINAGASFLPEDKPSLMPGKIKTAASKTPIFYSVDELRAGIQAFEPDTVAKTSRILGVIISGTHCFCLYYTGHTRMYWMKNQEENTVAAIDTLLSTRGITCAEFDQVVIGSNLGVAVRIAKYKADSRSKYFTVSDEYNHCYFLENSHHGDELLKLLINPALKRAVDQSALRGFVPPPEWSRTYDAISKDGQRPVVLGYTYDLLKLQDLDGVHRGFTQSPILLCLDYQLDSLQMIVGPKIEVRSIPEGDDISH